ncbi:MAG: hypothetical protein AAFU49_11795 [Pseudomonadota bacterium]
MSRPLEIVLHVPKCAGSTLEGHLHAHLGPPVFWSAPKRTRSLPLELFGRKYRATLPAAPDTIRAVSGHYIGRSVETLFPGRQMIRSVLLREPKSLVLSWYNFRMMRYAAQGMAPYPFGLHLRCLAPDPLSHFLLSHWLEIPWLRLARMTAAEKLVRLEEALGQFDFVGDISECDQLVAALSKRLGLPEQAAKENSGHAWAGLTSWQPLRLDTLAPDDREALTARTHLDACLYARVVEGKDAPLRDASSFFDSEVRRPLAELKRRRLRGLMPRTNAPAPWPDPERPT